MPDPVQATPAAEQIAPAAVNVDELLNKTLAEQPEAPPAPAAPPAQTSWEDVVFESDKLPEYLRGKKASEVAAYAESNERARRELQSKYDRLANEAAQLRITQIAEKAVRDNMAAQQQAQQRPAEPQEDPRWAKVEELHMQGEYAQAGELRRQLIEEAADKRASVKVNELHQQLSREAEQTKAREIGAWAYQTAMTEIVRRGVPQEHLTRRRVAALYSALTTPPTADDPNPHYLNGGPNNPAAVVALYGEMFGFPQQHAPIAPNEQPVIPSAPAPIVSAPPGSGRPAPAAGPTSDRAAPMRRELQDLYATIAEERGWNPEKFVERARNRTRGAA